MPLPPKIGSPEFLALQAEWATKLAESGFDDIEYSDGSLKVCGPQPRVHGRREYYERCQEGLTDLDFESTFNPREQKIIALHAEGGKRRDICRELHAGSDLVQRTIDRFRAFIRIGE